MLDPFDAAELRRCAERCAATAQHKSGVRPERERLMTIHAALLALAETADWLSGRSCDNAVQAAAE